MNCTGGRVPRGTPGKRRSCERCAWLDARSAGERMKRRKTSTTGKLAFHMWKLKGNGAFT